MMKRVPAGALDLIHETIDAGQVLAGSPTVGHQEIWSTPDGRSCGVWEHAVGVSIDVEEDETFVVLSGRARIRAELAGDVETIDVGPGDVVRLDAGASTRWDVVETLRKVYVTGPRQA